MTTKIYDDKELLSQKFIKTLEYKSNHWYINDLFRSLLNKKMIIKSISQIITFLIIVTFVVLAIFGKSNVVENNQWYTYLIFAPIIWVIYSLKSLYDASEIAKKVKNGYYTLDPRMHFVLSNKKHLINLLYITAVIPPVDVFYKIFFINTLYLSDKGRNSIEKVDELIYLINLESENKFSRFKNVEFKFDVYEMSIAGITMGLFLIVQTLVKFTALSKVGLNFEYVFYIIYAIFFTTYKAALLGVASDFFALLFNGGIWSWYWMYAIVPIAVVLITKLFIFMYKTKSIKAVIATFVTVLISLFSTFLTIILVSNSDNPKFFVKNKKTNLIEGLKISKIFGVGALTDATLYIIIAISFILTFVLLFIMLYVYTKQDQNKRIASHFINLFMIIGIVLIVMIVCRWIYGPYVFINYANLFLKRNYTVGNNYLIIMIPIIFRTLISIPIYVLILSTLFSLLELIKNKIEAKKTVKYI
ncbi:hypothetical protein [Mycoplasma sp. 4079]|uniref:hypothetical protein n=1 Tax=Mycoplasma sp. 4079 TaxID=3398615 RepID=UPI0039FC3E75